MKYKAYILIGEYDSELEAVEVLAPYEQDGQYER